MRRHWVLLTALVGIWAGAAWGQPDSLWAKAFGGDSVAECISMGLTTDGGLILAGSTNSFGAGNYDFWLVRTGENGDSLWSRTYGGDNYDFCTDMVYLTDGGIALAGMTYSFGSGECDFWLVRTDENGDSLWSRTFGGVSSDGGTSIIQTTDGGLALAGTTQSYGAGSGDFWLILLNAEGDSLWSHTYGGENDDECTSLIQTTDGGFAMSGKTLSFGAGQEDFWLVRTDEEGNSLWSQTFGGEGYDRCNSLILTNDGGFALAGNTTTYGAGFDDSWLVRTDENGNIIWSHGFGGGAWVALNALIQTADGGFALAGFTGHYGPNYRPNGDAWLVRADESGDSLWTRSFGGRNRDEFFSIIQTPEGGFALAGFTASFGAGFCDFWLVKTAPDPLPPSPFRLIEPVDGDTIGSKEATFIWERSADPNPVDTVLYALWLKIEVDSVSYAAADTSLSVSLDSIGLNVRNWQPVTWWVQAISPPDTVECERRFTFQLDVEGVSNQAIAPRNFGLLPAYPNPFNASTLVGWQLPVGDYVNLNICDIRGRMMQSLVSGFQTAGRHQLIWNAASVAAGEYFVRLSDMNGRSRVQMISLVK